MNISYANFNGVRHDDLDKIQDYKKIHGKVFIDEYSLELYVLRLQYKDGTFKEIRVYMNADTKSMLSDSEFDNFLVKRLFGNDGLIIKERRNDYIYLGGIDKTDGKISRFIKTDDGRTMQQVVDNYLKMEVFPFLSFKNMSENFDVFNMDYFFHVGPEDMNDVFKNGLISRFGKTGTGINDIKSGYASLTSTFWPVGCELNNLYDSVKQYGESTTSKGNHVFILRIPKLYRGKERKTGSVYPPLPTHKMIDYMSGECIIIPEIIFAMYDTTNGILYKNSNYNPKYDPSGLVYDDETFKSASMYGNGQWDEFMDSRKEIPFDTLYKYDKQNGTFDEICKYYNINHKDDSQVQKKR